MHAARTVLALLLIVVLCGVGGALGGASDETEFLTLLYNATCGWEWHDSAGWLEGPPCADDAPAWAGLTCSGGRVTSLALVANNLCGALPEGWGALDALRTLALDANSIGGDLPGTLGQLTALERLSLSHTALSGSLPVSLALLRRLTYLNVSAARLTGSIPTDYGRLTALQTLALASNVLSGAVPTELARLVSAHTVDLSDNALSGTLSPLLVGMRSLTALLLHDNALSGDFPPFIAQFPSLRALSLAANNLSGALPDFFRTESELRNELRAIDPALVNVSANYWTAPPCWCALTTCASLVPGVLCANHSSSSSPEHVAVALIILLTFLVVLTMAVAWARRWQRTRSPTYDTLPQREQGKEAKEAPLLLESDL